MKKGFTLIELLVVITLIGILAVAVLSALNPIEQINKARDAGRRSDAAQIMSAIDRYFASTEQFPWNNVGWDDINKIATIDTAFKVTAEKAGVGICGVAAPGNPTTGVSSDATGCTIDGLLISSSELKSQFGKRKAFRTTPVAEDVFYVIKETNDPSVAVCFIPSSKATRTDWAKLKRVDLAAPDSIIACPAAPAAGDWAVYTTACLVCIPEE